MFDISTKIPWPVILYKYVKEWKKEHDDAIPVVYKEKVELRERIKKGILYFMKYTTFSIQ